MNTTGTARFHYRLGANQPAESATARRLAEMAAAIGHDTGGALRLEVYPESRLGPDPKMFADLQAGALEFYLSGALLGGVAPTSALPLLPFAFRDSDSVFAALDGPLGDRIRAELPAAGFHRVPPLVSERLSPHDQRSAPDRNRGGFRRAENPHAGRRDRRRFLPHARRRGRHGAVQRDV